MREAAMREADRQKARAARRKADLQKARAARRRRKTRLADRQRGPPLAPMFEPTAWYSAKAIADKAEIHPQTVWKWRASGRLPCGDLLNPGTRRWRGAVLNEAFANG